MCRDTTHGGRRCPSAAVTDPTEKTIRAAARRARDNRLLAQRARAEKRHADARRYEAHAAKADRARWDARDSRPFGPVASVETVDAIKARARKALLAAMEADGFTEDRGYGKQYNTAAHWKNDIILLARDEHGRLIGAAGINVVNNDVQVHDLWIQESAQRTGAGTELMGQAAHLATRVAKKGEARMYVTSALSEAQPFYAKHGAEFRGDSQTGNWNDPRVVHALASKARYVDGPPAPVVSLETERAEQLDYEGKRLRSLAADRAKEGKGRTLPAYLLDEDHPYSLFTSYPWASKDELLAELSRRKVPLVAA